jgi:hypothetical protein
MQRIERVEEPFLGLFLATNELNIVNQEYVHSPVLRMEISSLSLADRRDELVGEVLSRHAMEPYALGLKAVAYSLEKVRLAQAHAPVDEQRVVRLSWLVSDSLRCGKRQVVGGTYDKCVEGVPGV